MPLYDFKCNSCSEEFETLVMGSDVPVCPKCHSGDLSKQMSTFAFRGGGQGSDQSAASESSGSKCSGCAASSCATCH